MPRYLLDTDICSYIIKRSSKPLLDRLRHIPAAEMAISVITQAELLYGAEISAHPRQDRQAVEGFLALVAVLEFSEEAAADYAVIRADLKRRGMLIGANDLLIAAHARSLGLILVTNNQREFSRVEGLKLENWTE